MKKLGLLFVSAILLTGCSATNGMVNKSDIESASYESIKPLVEEQKKVSYIPDDVKEFVSKAKEVNDRQFESANQYLDIRLQDMDYMGNSEFLYEIYRDYSESGSSTQFNKLIDVLDETISKGIKLYIDKNIDSDLEKSGKVMKIGRVWIIMTPIDKDLLEENYGDSEVSKNSQLDKQKNEVMLLIKVKDVKDEKYKKVIESVQGEDLILRSIKIGKEQNLVELNNIESKQFGGYIVNKPAINCQLFMKDENINKVRISLTSLAKEKINNELKLLGRISHQLEFNSQDMKKLEEIKVMIKENEADKKSVSSENFNFSYKNLENKDLSYEINNLTEIIIERKN